MARRRERAALVSGGEGSDSMDSSPVAVEVGGWIGWGDWVEIILEVVGIGGVRGLE